MKSFLAVKMYPEGEKHQITTNSAGGLKPSDPRILQILANLQDHNIPLCVHGETSGFVMDREKEFGVYFQTWANKFPKLKIIMEHITTADSVNLLNKYQNLYATVTLHHLMITMDDWAGEKLRPHLFCKPVAKRPEDRAALRQAVFSGHPKIMFGSDSAPHPKSAKECCGCAAGVFTAPIALQVLIEEFKQAGSSFENLQAFVSWNARKIYQITPPINKVILSRSVVKGHGFTIPDKYGEVVPFLAGTELPWKFISKE